MLQNNFFMMIREFITRANFILVLLGNTQHYCPYKRKLMFYEIMWFYM